MNQFSKRAMAILEHVATDGAEITPELKVEAQYLLYHELYDDVLVDYWMVHALADKIERMCLSCERQLDCDCSEDSGLCVTEWCPSCLARNFMERHRTKSKGLTQEND